ncbi:gamma-glutamyltransferase [Frateuria aurantia]|uniref:Glutathione hydrolase proenzyme n=1 Tax=Frateuria aurantia (strain ATCC 33424 / DSM 6220 / KCTC 2777 / LMG 1558 / NBRC 3245 / NCIMB 13370) TaxID=767434 RepID=H8KYA0_FRAAD|nr:gamma-glutamyltransferase [Frateuria aurantia]AFC86094.1 gamma-glutamyltranspeptidase [Frateuria aurantia DSM 6220]
MMRAWLALGSLGLMSMGSLAWADAPAAKDVQVSGRALDSTAPPTTLAQLAKDVPVHAPHAMVVSDQHYATEVGVRILRAGGNAIDAAVAVGYAQAVVNPCCGNIGGGGYLVAHMADGRNLFLDFREKAPLKATPTMFQDGQGRVMPDRSTLSYLGTGVPGTVMGLNEALQRYGTMKLAQVIQPAIDLARNGFVLQQGDVNIFNRRVKDFAKEPNVAAIFLNHGQPWQVGETLRQPELARTLESIRDGGSKAFYHGPIAQAVVKASQANGGLLSLRDFADYTVQWDSPVQCDYHGYHLVSAPPPSSGGVTVCEILLQLQPYPLAKWGYASAQAIHYQVEAERRAFADRNSVLGDPAFVHNPIAELLSPAHIAKLQSTIQPVKATPSSEIKGDLDGSEGTNTTHYSVVDAKGNAVGVTYTINFLFGTGHIAGDTGFFLNDEMDDFTSKPGVPNAFGLVQGKANQVEPGKRPLSSMTPTVVLKNGKVFMVTGSPGGSTIISTVLQSILNVTQYGMNVQQAVNAPRMHHQWYPDQVNVEPGLLTPQVQQQLEQAGYRFHTVNSWGADEAILVDPSGGLDGANDRRRPAGLAAGY